MLNTEGIFGHKIMEFKLVQYRDKDIKKFNDEINKLLSEDWTLNGDLRITVVNSEDGPSYIVNSQLLERDIKKTTMGFNVN